MSHRSNQPEQQQKTQQRQKRVLISFPSYDQDSWEYKKNDETFLNSFMIQGKGKPGNRHQIWRPSVALAQLSGLDKDYEDLIFDEYYLLWDEKENHKQIVDEIKEDIEKLNPHPTLHIENPGIKKPFDSKDVYQYLYSFLSKDKFHHKDTQYYVNCTNGTTQMRNCLFLLTQTGHIDALRIAPTPWKNHRQRDRKADGKTWFEDGRRTVKGSYTIEYPQELYEACTNISKETQASTSQIIKKGTITKDETKGNHIAYIIEKIKNIADAELKAKQSILITGETGTGKTQLAQNIAEAFDNKDKFISLNCATIRGSDANIQKIDLFGCVDGALPGITERKGALAEADKGVLFLDEIGELHPEVQAMLLTALDKGEFVPFGGNPSNPKKSSFQLISGTNRDLEQLITEGLFRSDLFNRINAWHFELDPIRDRRDDIQLNISDVLKGLAARDGMKHLAFAPGAEDLFVKYANDETITWDGNFRELNAMITRMAILSDGIIITKEIVESEFKDAKERYRLKREMNKVTRAVTTPRQCEPPATQSPCPTFLDGKRYDALSPFEKAELYLLSKTINDEHAYSLEEICKIVYGGKYTIGGLQRRLERIFKLHFARGRLEPLEAEPTIQKSIS